MGRTFDDLVREAELAPIKGWDFSWLEGRAKEARPSWGYSRLAADRLATVSSALDIDTGGGELLARIGKLPPTMVATESWPPNVAVAKERLARIGVRLVETSTEPTLPFESASFDLVLNRHGVRGRAATHA